MRALEEQKLNARGVLPEHDVSRMPIFRFGGQLTANDKYDGRLRRSFRRRASRKRPATSATALEYNSWRRKRTHDPGQPMEGFTISANEDHAQVELLCQAYQKSDRDGRRLIQLCAQLSLMEEDGRDGGRQVRAMKSLADRVARWLLSRLRRRPDGLAPPAAGSARRVQREEAGCLPEEDSRGLGSPPAASDAARATRGRARRQRSASEALGVLDRVAAMGSSTRSTMPELQPVRELPFARIAKRFEANAQRDRLPRSRSSPSIASASSPRGWRGTRGADAGSSAACAPERFSRSVRTAR